MDLNGINKDEISNMQIAIGEYKSGFDQSLTDLSKKIELAGKFKDSLIAETLKNYLESVVNEIQKVTSYVDEFNQSLDSTVQNEKEVVEVELTPVVNSENAG